MEIPAIWYNAQPNTPTFVHCAVCICTCMPMIRFRINLNYLYLIQIEKSIILAPLISKKVQKKYGQQHFYLVLCKCSDICVPIKWLKIFSHYLHWGLATVRKLLKFFEYLWSPCAGKGKEVDKLEAQHFPSLPFFPLSLLECQKQYSKRMKTKGATDVLLW